MSTLQEMTDEEYEGCLAQFNPDARTREVFDAMRARRAVSLEGEPGAAVPRVSASGVSATASEWKRGD